jgi:DNA-binding MurR/RpiR family transcriptional regulator
MIESMSNNKQREMTIAELAKEMREGFNTMRQEIRSEMKEELSHMKEYVQQGFEAMNENIGGVEKRLTDKIEAFEDRTFSPDEKESILDTVKLINDRLADNVVGRMDITLTREEYDMLMESVRLPNRFLKPEMIEVE